MAAVITSAAAALRRISPGRAGVFEFSVDDLLGFSNARLTLGAEVQHDDVRGTQGFAVARLRVPLQQETKAPRLTAQERRMTERVVRDVDIVSVPGAARRSAREVREDAINSWNGQVVISARRSPRPIRQRCRRRSSRRGQAVLLF